MKTTSIRAVWKSRISELLQAKGTMLGLERPIRPEEVANELGVSRQTIYTWMGDDGINMLTADNAAKLERYFGVPVWSIWRLVAVDAIEDTEPGQQAALIA